MAYQRFPVGIVFDQYKLAGLYFDRIYVCGTWYFDQSLNPPPELLFKVPENMMDNIIFREAERIQANPNHIAEIFNNVADYGEVKAIYYARYLSTREYPCVPMVFSQSAFNFLYEKGTLDSLQVVIGGLPLFDAPKAEWKQILEVRKDKKSLSSLRDLKLFFASNYEGKSADFVIDDVNSKLERFERARKKHGFDLITSSVKVLLDAKSVLSLAALGLAAAFVGSPMAVSTALAAGISIEVGKLAINIAEKKRVFADDTQNNELGYLVELKKKFD